MLCFVLFCCVCAGNWKTKRNKTKISPTRIETETLMQFSFFSFLFSFLLSLSLVAGKFCCKSLLQHEQEEEANTQVAPVGSGSHGWCCHCYCLPQLCQRWRENPLELNYVNRLKQTNAECVKSEKGETDLCAKRQRGTDCDRLNLSIQHKQATNFQRIKSIKMQIHAHSLMLSSICRYIIGWWGGEGVAALMHELFSRQLDSPKCISNVCATERQKVQMKFVFSFCSLSLFLIECPLQV